MNSERRQDIIQAVKKMEDMVNILTSAVGSITDSTELSDYSDDRIRTLIRVKCEEVRVLAWEITGVTLE